MALDALEAEPDVRVIVLAAPRGRSARAPTWPSAPALDERAVFAHRKRVVACSTGSPAETPLVAAVPAPPTAGAPSSRLLCDVVLAAASRLPFPRWRLASSRRGGCYTLVRAVGLPRQGARTNRAQGARSRGAGAWPGEPRRPVRRLLAEAHQLAAAIAQNPPIAVKQAKRALDFAAEHDFASSLAFEAEAYHACVTPPIAARRSRHSKRSARRARRGLTASCCSPSTASRCSPSTASPSQRAAVDSARQAAAAREPRGP